MRIIWALVFLFIIFVSSAVIFTPTPLASVFSYSICDEPVHYRIDTVDPKFNLSRDDFSSSTAEAAQIWNEVLAKDLFVYDPKGNLSVNLIYDGRQSLTNQINQLEDTIQSEKQSLKPKISEYQKLSAEFKQKIADLNKTIEYWNNQGGAPSDEYQKIITKQQELKAEADRLNAMADNLNLSTDQYNTEVNKLNQTITTFNETLEERPEEGIFKGSENRIEIYFNINKDELVHTLAHELGHAIALPHNSNSKAIMYYKTNQNTSVSTEDIQALEEACKERSIFEPIQNYVAETFAKLQVR